MVSEILWNTSKLWFPLPHMKSSNVSLGILSIQSDMFLIEPLLQVQFLLNPSNDNIRSSPYPSALDTTVGGTRPSWDASTSVSPTTSEDSRYSGYANQQPYNPSCKFQQPQPLPRPPVLLTDLAGRSPSIPRRRSVRPIIFRWIWTIMALE